MEIVEDACSLKRSGKKAELNCTPPTAVEMRKRLVKPDAQTMLQDKIRIEIKSECCGGSRIEGQMSRFIQALHQHMEIDKAAKRFPCCKDALFSFGVERPV